MKITRSQLRRIIREAIDPREMEEPLGGWVGDALTNDPDYPEPARPDGWEVETEPDHMDSAEYDRGYQDGLDAFPIADDANPDYDAGYEDGALDAHLGDQGPPPTQEEEAEEEMRYAAGRPWEHN